MHYKFLELPTQSELPFLKNTQLDNGESYNSKIGDILCTLHTSEEKRFNMVTFLHQEFALPWAITKQNPVAYDASLPSKLHEMPIKAETLTFSSHVYEVTINPLNLIFIDRVVAMPW